MKARKSTNFLNVRYWTCCLLFKVIVISGICLILVRAFRLQVIEHQVWLERAHAQTETTLKVSAYRGSIVDRQNRLLSFSVRQRSLFADGELIESPKSLAARLSQILEEPQSSLEKKLTFKRHFVWLKRLLPDQQALAVDDLKARGLNLIDEYKRFYPFRQVGGQVLGFVGLDGVGLEGIEKAFDQVLRENSVTLEQTRDGVRKSLWLQSFAPPEPKESVGVRLTLDMFIQYLTECELEKTALQYKAKAGEIVVLDAQTSEILAMANWPFFDPNLSDKRAADSWRNRAVTDSFEPGSTFKVFLMSAALEQGVVRVRDRIFCENGKFQLARNTINDVHPYGWLTIPEVVKYSSNIGATKLALQLGSERYYHYIRAFGFGSPTGITFPGEVKGLLRPWKRWRPIDLATTGFGQGIGVTALQLSQGVACIAYEGECLPPVLAREIVDSNGNVLKQLESQPSRRAIQKETAREICDMMKSVTKEGGTGVKAAPEGYSAAGKTGTAQVLEPGTGRYASNKFTSIFTGFVPSENPRLVITVVIHEPHGANYGGVVAAPAFRNIAAKALPYLGVLPVFEETPPPVKLRTADATQGKAHGDSAQAKPAKGTKIPTPVPAVSKAGEINAPQGWLPLGTQTKGQGIGKEAGQRHQTSTPLKPKTAVELVRNTLTTE